MKKATVQNMVSSNGNVIANQFQIITNEGTYFQSYTSTIAFIKNGGQVYLDENKWNYSVTTSKYRNIFLGEKKAETQHKIDSGEYKLTDLNK